MDRRRGGGHLPAGHSPGAQSRRVARGQPLAVLIIGLLTALLLGGAIVLLATASHDKSPTGARVAAAIIGGFGLLLVPLVFFLWRRWRPRRARYVELRVEPVELRRGDTVSATIVIADAGKLGEKLELGLVCTEYHDYEKTVQTQTGSRRQRVTGTDSAFAQWDLPDRNQAQQTFRFTVPPEAPFSYEGGTVSWAWHVSALDRHDHRPDAHYDVPIWVSP